MQHAKGQECKADQGSHRQDNGQADIHPNQTQEKVIEEAKKKHTGEENDTTQVPNYPPGNEKRAV